MEGSFVSYKIKLEVALRLDQRQWLAWCPSIDVMTQADTKKKALESLQEAVELWFESCIERDVLDEALTDAGFYKAKPSGLSQTVNTVHVFQVPATANAAAFAGSDALSFSRGRKGGSEYIEVSIPAYVAAHQLGQTARAPC